MTPREENEDLSTNLLPKPTELVATPHISRRDYFGAAALQGLLAQKIYEQHEWSAMAATTELAVEYALALENDLADAEESEREGREDDLITELDKDDS